MERQLAKRKEKGNYTGVRKQSYVWQNILQRNSFTLPTSKVTPLTLCTGKKASIELTTWPAYAPPSHNRRVLWSEGFHLKEGVGGI